jgi:glutamine cyclotransferase
VLNGIAAVPGTDTFLITGKLWPWMFKVRFVADGWSGPAGTTR